MLFITPVKLDASDDTIFHIGKSNTASFHQTNHHRSLLFTGLSFAGLSTVTSTSSSLSSYGSKVCITSYLLLLPIMGVLELLLWLRHHHNCCRVKTWSQYEIKKGVWNANVYLYLCDHFQHFVHLPSVKAPSQKLWQPRLLLSPSMPVWRTEGMVYDSHSTADILFLNQYEA